MSPLYDEAAGLLWSPEHMGERHLVRESAWYALGLVIRHQLADEHDRGDLSRAARLVDSVLNEQWHAPGCAWHGSFRRAPEEPDPPADAVIWRDYDPNWRQFIGTTLLLLLRLEGDRALSPLADRMTEAITQCVMGEPRDRVSPSYTNIALMRAWLDIETAGMTPADYRDDGLAYARDIANRFSTTQTFAEYNSPTYYGINFFALGLWQHYSDSADLRALGASMTDVLWRDVSRYYHAGFKNLCGPWSRSYGMDMQNYVAALGLWIWAVTGEDAAPFPMASLNSGEPLNHDHDFCLGPLSAITATQPHADALSSFRDFSGERAFSKVISESPRREAHVLLTSQLMVGLETADISFRGTPQYHPLTCHWASGQGVSWFRLRFAGRLQGQLRNGRIEVTLIADDGVDACRIESGPGELMLREKAWHGDGLVVQVTTGLEMRPGDAGIELHGIEGEAKLILTPIVRPVS